MDEQEGGYFSELYRRAHRLAGICSACGERPLTRMGLARHRSGYLAQVGFYCDKCGYRGGSTTEYHPPSFFIGSHYLSKREGKLITGEVTRQFIGAGNLTQSRMETFFRTNENFTNARRYFFEQHEQEVAA